MLHTNPLFVRSHDFIGIENSNETWKTTQLFGTEDRYKELEERYPLKRPAHVHEITDLIVFLASYRSGYTSGTIFTVDGGIASRRSVI